MSDKLAFKKEVLNAGIKKQQQLVNNFEENIEEIRVSERGVNESQFDLTQAGLNEEMEDHIEQLSSQLKFAQDEMTVLKKIDANASTPLAHFGSIVETDKLTFFISVSLEKLVVGDRVVYGISRMAPIYKAMEGKKPGDSFEFNDNKYLIKDVY